MNDRQGPAQLRYVRHATRNPKPAWISGLDLGQRKDHTALSVIELSWQERGQCKIDYAWLYEPQFVLRGLERVPLGLTYERIHEIVAEKMQILEERIVRQTHRAAPAQELIIDAGGPGPPMVDRLRRTLKKSVKITPAIITGGKSENTLTKGYISIPRRSILTRLVHMINAQILRCPVNLEGWDEFAREFCEISAESSQPANSRSHDDMVMSTGLAAWLASRDVPQLIPGSADNDGTTYGFINKPIF